MLHMHLLITFVVLQLFLYQLFCAVECIVVSHCAEYKDEDLIPKNTSVVVARIPIKRPNKGRPRCVFLSGLLLLCCLDKIAICIVTTLFQWNLHQPFPCGFFFQMRTCRVLYHEVRNILAVTCLLVHSVEYSVKKISEFHYRQESMKLCVMQNVFDQVILNCHISLVC